MPLSGTTLDVRTSPGTSKVSFADVSGTEGQSPAGTDVWELKISDASYGYKYASETGFAGLGDEQFICFEVKPDDLTRFSINWSSGPFPRFLLSGAGSITAGDASRSGIRAETDGWYTVWMYDVNGLAFNAYWHLIAEADGAVQFTGTVGERVLIGRVWVEDAVGKSEPAPYLDIVVPGTAFGWQASASGATDAQAFSVGGEALDWGVSASGAVDAQTHAVGGIAAGLQVLGSGAVESQQFVVPAASLGWAVSAIGVADSQTHEVAGLAFGWETSGAGALVDQTHAVAGLVLGWSITASGAEPSGDLVIPGTVLGWQISASGAQSVAAYTVAGSTHAFAWSAAGALVAVAMRVPGLAFGFEARASGAVDSEVSGAQLFLSLSVLTSRVQLSRHPGRVSLSILGAWK